MRKLKHKNTLIIVTGCPGTGKSFWAEQICAGIENITPLSYDQIKEINWDKYGFFNREEKDALNAISLNEFYSELENLMQYEKSILIEYPFYQRHKKTIADLIEKYSYHAVTLLLYGDMQVIFERGINRDISCCRHRGHLQNRYHKAEEPTAVEIDPEVKLTLEEFIDSCNEKNYDVRLGNSIDIDITDFHRVEAESVLDRIVELS